MTRRVLLASDTRGHTAGYYVVAQALRDAGFEVIVTGQQLPREIAAATAQEDADLIALRIMDRDPVEVVTGLIAEMQAIGLDGVPLLVGGIVHRKDAARLRELGVAGVFGPGSKLSDITDCARRATAEESGGTGG
ncbi:MAG: methylmalonyl-CoA mutase, C-terminal domain [Candidatus Binatota bacterium]|nr:methylmalonyl-CoA mutase, C-terminal domain [Candidatus Binatota bacterium]